MSKWTTEYDNHDSDGSEFWTIRDESGNTVAEAYSADVAQKLADYPDLLDALEDAIQYLQHHLPKIATASIAH